VFVSQHAPDTIDKARQNLFAGSFFSCLLRQEGIYYPLFSEKLFRRLLDARQIRLASSRRHLFGNHSFGHLSWVQTQPIIAIV